MMSAFFLRIVERSNWVSPIPQEVDHALRLRFGKLDKTAVQAVVTAQVEVGATNARILEITGEHSKDITVVMQTLVRDGLLTKQNQRRWPSYRVAGDSPQSSPQLQSDSPQLGGDFPQFDRRTGQSHLLDGESTNKNAPVFWRMRRCHNPKPLAKGRLLS
jgi:hypothetical protein